LAAVCVKFILAPPVVLYWLWKREWKPLAWFAGFSALLNGLALLRMDVGAVMKTMLPSFKYYAAWEKGLHGGSSHVMNWAEIYEWVFGPGSTAASLAGLATLAVAGAGLWWVCRRWEEDREGWVLAAIVMFTLVAAYHRVYDGVFIFVPAACLWNAARTPSSRRLALYLTGAATALFLFGFSIQNVATALEVRLKAHGALAAFAPVNAWLALALLGLTLWSGIIYASRRNGLQLSCEEAEPALVA
jgi:hypothetical protein